MRRKANPSPRRRPSPLGALWLAFALLPSFASRAEPPTVGKAAPHVRASVNVTVLDLDVVAREDGRPVADLRGDELVVKIGGRPLPIDHFAHVGGARIAKPRPGGEAAPSAGGLEPAPSVPLQLLLYFDDARLQPWQRRVVIDGARKLLERLGPGDEASIVSYNGTTNVLVPFTGDRARLAEGLSRLRSIVPRGLVRAGQFRRVAAAMEAEDRDQRILRSPQGAPRNLKDVMLLSWAEEERTLTLGGLEELRRTVSALAGRPGRRRMILVTTGWERIPGQTMAQLGFGRSTMRQFSTTTTNATEAVFHAANRSGVTIDVVDAKGFEDELDTELAERREVGPWIARLNARDGMATIAEATGGAFVEGQDVLDRSLAEIWDETGDYYSVGVTFPAALQEGEVKTVTISCTRPGVTVRTRTSVGALSEAEAARDLAESALLAPPSTSAFPVRLVLGTPRPDGFLSRRRVTRWQLFIPGGELTFVPEGALRSTVVEVVITAADDSGGRSDLTPERFTVTLPAARLAEAAMRDVPLEGLVRTRPGRHRIVATVRDVASGRTAVATASLPDE